jgi:hypothetical protein
MATLWPMHISIHEGTGLGPTNAPSQVRADLSAADLKSYLGAILVTHSTTPIKSIAFVTAVTSIFSDSL